MSDYTTLLYGTSPTSAFQSEVIGELCTSAQELCSGSNIQYNSVDECISTLSAKPFGDWDELWGDNVVCRTLHILLAKLRPAVSTLSAGPTVWTNFYTNSTIGTLSPCRAYWWG